MKKVLVTGASGMVGSGFCRRAKESLTLITPDEKTLDLTSRKSVTDFFASHQFEAVVNFAAFTNVDAAEKERGNKQGLAWQLNAMGPKTLQEACLESGRFLVQISTDFIFPGTKENPGPYSEDAQLPETEEGISWYGWTKLLGEKSVDLSRFAVVRYGYPFTPGDYPLKLDWARNLLKLYREQKLYPLFTDQIQSVILVDDLFPPFLKIIEGELKGIFHVVSADTTTPYEIGGYLLNLYSGQKVEVVKGSMTEFLKAPGRTPRPRLGGLRTEKTQNTLGLKFRSWREMIADFTARTAKP
jgi:dTDP-4-dehydrorhamnose reductase